MKRIDHLLALALQSGSLTSYVQSKINGLPKDSKKFTEEFLKLKPGLDTEKKMYQAVVAEGKPKNLVPVTVDGPNGTKITYYTTPDYVKVNGIRVPVSGQTAQKIADEFGMVLPTPRMVDQIYQAADTKIFTSPLSAGGQIGDKYYSGEEVVKNKIGDADSSLAYNQSIDKALEGKKPTLVAGHMKEIVAPNDPNKLGIYGWFYKDKPIQSSPNSPHDVKVHREYGTGLRLIDQMVTVTNPDGTSKQMKIEDLAKDPQLGKAISTNGLNRYNLD